MAGRDGEEVGWFVDFEPVPVVAGDDRGLAGEELDEVVGRIRLGGAEVEADRAAQAANGLVGEWVLLPVIGVDVVGCLGAEDRGPPFGAGVREPAFVGANGRRRLEMEVVGEQVNDGDAGGRVAHALQCHERNPPLSWTNVAHWAHATSSTASHGATATAVGVNPANDVPVEVGLVDVAALRRHPGGAVTRGEAVGRVVEADQPRAATFVQDPTPHTG